MITPVLVLISSKASYLIELINTSNNKDISIFFKVFCFRNLKYVELDRSNLQFDESGFQDKMQCERVQNPDPEVIKLFSCPTQLSMKF